jgi:hypothetical protein
MVSDSRALFELGLLVGLGVIFSLYATLFFLPPPLLVYSEGRFPAAVCLSLPGFGLAALWNLSRRTPRRTGAVSLLLHPL